MGSWGDNDPILLRPKAAPAAAAWGDADPALKGPVKRKTNEALGFDEGFTRPIDNVAHWMDSGLQHLGVPMDRINRAVGQPTTDETNAQHQADFKAQERTERPGTLGRVAGGVVGTAPFTVVTENPLAVGAIQGGLQTEHPDDPLAVGGDAAMGAAFNKLGGVAINKLGGVLKPAIDPAVRMLRDAGVRLTPGQIKGGKAMGREDKAMSQPRVGEAIAADRAQGISDFNRGAVNRALMPLGVRLPEDIQTGHDAVAFMQDAVKKAYDKITPNLTLKPDVRLLAGLRKAAGVVADLPEREADIFSKVVGNKLDFSQGTMAGRQLAVTLRDLRKAAAGYSRSGSEAERQLGEAISHVDDAVHSSLGLQNPGYAQALKATNQAYRGDRIVSDAAKGADEGIASTGQIKASVRANDRSKNQRRTAAGQAYMQDYAEAGRKVLPSKTPDSGTAGRIASDKLLPNIRGAADLAGYKLNKAYSGFLVADRPPWLQKLGGLLQDYRGQGGLLSGGLLSGLSRDE